MLNRFKYIIVIILITLNYSCTVKDYQLENQVYPCLGDCDEEFWIDPLVTPGLYEDENGYVHLPYAGVKYFTIKGKTSNLHPDHIINDVPVIATSFDSDYWYVFEDMQFSVPLYSPFGYFNEQGNAITIGSQTIDLSWIIDNLEPLNISGYSQHRRSDTSAPKATYSKYTTLPQQQFYYNQNMVGDTATCYMRVSYGKMDRILSRTHEIKVIFEN